MPAPLRSLLDRMCQRPLYCGAAAWTVLLASLALGVQWRENRQMVEFARTQFEAALAGGREGPTGVAPAEAALSASETASGRPSLSTPCLTSAGLPVTLPATLETEVFPLRPAAAPPVQDWEALALGRLAQGADQVEDVVLDSGAEQYRRMYPLRMTAECRRCHAEDGREGDLLGGLRVTMPLRAEWARSAHTETRAELFGLGLLWVLGLVGLVRGQRLVDHQQRSRDEILATLTERNRLLRAIIETSPDGFWMADLEGRILEVNDVLVRRSGYTREELLRMNVSQLEAPESQGITRRRFDEVIQTGHGLFEALQLTRDGTLWEAEVNLARWTHGESRLVAFVRDTVQRRSSEFLLRTRGQLATLAQTADPEDLVQLALDKAELLSGSPASFLLLLQPDGTPSQAPSFSRRTRRTLGGAAPGGDFLADWPGERWRNCVERLGPILDNERSSDWIRRCLLVPVVRRGGVVAVLGVANRTIPYTLEAADQLEAVASMAADFVLSRQARTQLEHLFQVVPDPVVICDLDARLQRLSPAWELVLGVPVGELQLSGLGDRLHPEDRRASLITFSRARSGAQIAGFINRLRARDGSYRWLEWNAAPLPGSRLLFGIARDITARQRSDELLRVQHQFSLGLAATRDFDGMLRHCVETALKVTGLEVAGLYLRDRTTGELRLRLSIGLSPGFVAAVEHYAAGTPQATLMERGRPVYGLYPEVRPDAPEVCRAEGLRAIAMLPIRHQNRTIGALNIASRRVDAVPTFIRAVLETLIAPLGRILADREAQQALLESEARFRLLFEGAQDAIVWADAETGTIVECNHAAENLFGRARAELLGKPQTFLHPPDLESKYREAFREHVRIGRDVAETELIRNDGTRLVALISTSVAVIGGKRLIQGAFRDITARKEAEAEAHRQNALLQAFFDNAPFLICLVNENRGVERMNAAMERMVSQLGSTAGTVGNRPGDLLGCLQAASGDGCGRGPGCETCVLRQAVQGTLTTGEPRSRVEFHFQRAAAGELRLSVSTARVQVEGQAKVLVCIEDVTATRHLEAQLQQAQKMEAIGQLAGGVAHDFNNIVAVILLHLHLVQEASGLSQEMRQSLKELEREAQRAAALTRQLLLFGRRQVAQVRRLDLNEVIQGVLKMLGRLIGEHMDLRFSTSEPSQPVEADPGMIEQVVMNLCVNARDAMPRGGPVEISTTSVEVGKDEVLPAEARAGSFVRLTVADQGTGIDPHALPHIFEPFFTTKEAGKGTGLGLATVYGIVRQHHGWVTVETTVGRGTSFHVFLPRAATPAVPEVSTTHSQLPRGTETILVVEDDVGLLKTTSRLLQICGYRVIEARTGTVALERWHEAAAKPQLLFTDLVMPGGLGGLELATRLRAAEPSLRVLIASGYNAELFEQGTRLDGGPAFIAKPYTPTSLARAVRDCIDARPQVLTGGDSTASRRTSGDA